MVAARAAGLVMASVIDTAYRRYLVRHAMHTGHDPRAILVRVRTTPDR